MDEAEKADGASVEAWRDTSEVLELVEALLDGVAHSSGVAA